MPSQRPPGNPGASSKTLDPQTQTEQNLPHKPGPHASHASLDSTQSRQEYLGSLVPPSKDDFAHISEVQAHREAERKQRTRELRHKSIDAALVQSSISENVAGAGRPQSRKSRAHEPPRVDESSRNNAAILIQRTYRGYRARRELRGFGVGASTRWTYALRDAQFQLATEPKSRSELAGNVTLADDPQHEGRNSVESVGSLRLRSSTARGKWRKAATIALRAGADADADTDSSSSSDSSRSSGSATREQRRAARRQSEEAKAKRRAQARMMGLQYFLEMVDQKHRYGSNLRVYHEEWKRAETHENFFYWLDYGEGRFLDIEACPRERLDREQVRYLSREERQYYLATVDDQGRLCWAKNGARIDTTEKWKDSIHGIVPVDDPTPAFKPVTGNGTRLFPDSGTSSSPSDDDASESEVEAARAAKYANPDLEHAKGLRKIHHMSATTILDKLLRKSVRKNTWIFVADTNFRLYVGIKDSGAFQHSSFLQGSRISAAGLIRIQDGRLTSLSPLSGHYRPPASNFRAFVRSLREAGVDMGRVSISKSYAVLVGLEAYAKTRSKGKDLAGRLTRRRDRLVDPDTARRREEEEKDKSESAAREREVLQEQGRREERERGGAGAPAHLMRRLHIAPREPAADGDGAQGHSASTAVRTA